MDNGNNGNAQKTGAVLVVGAGIGGMQASLDLAEAGFRVYLAEKRSAIGGRMAQLDKTFPTNDCAMCTISPKLVETGRHRNIELLVDTEVQSVTGQAGNFTVQLKTRPRYIDVEKCTGCGDCASVCPVFITDGFNEGLIQQRAAHKLYPQAVPNAFAIEKRGIAPCRDACPAGQRAQGYIALVREGRYADALRVIKEDNPFPAICGRICNHRCEDACNRGKLDDPVNIHSLKRFVTDMVYAQPRVIPQKLERKYDEKIAVIGAGPCGLTAAQDLCLQGYDVTVFESLPVAGGMLRVGVPEFRLPSELVAREVQDILDLGVTLHLNTRVDNLDDLFAQGFKAVLIAVGAHEGRKLPIEGADLEGVLLNTTFLKDVRLGSPPDITGKRVVVLGGGNVAVDVARTAVRLGASEVHMACLESGEKMPAHPREIQACEFEGIRIHPSRSFKRILPDGEGRVSGIECVNVTHMEFTADGRLDLETEDGSEHVLPCDSVIFSIGQKAGLQFIPDSTGVATTRQGAIAVNPNTLAATRPGVFAAGDAATGTSFVIEGVAAGHRSAESIHRYLRGEELEPAPKPELPVVELTRQEIQQRVARGEAKLAARVPIPELPVNMRVAGFAEVEFGYTEEQAKTEAERCLSCGVCSECLSCSYACKADAINHNMVETVKAIEVGAIVMATGFDRVAPELRGEYGYGYYPNVLTGLEFERILSASGPTEGHVVRPSDGQAPKRVAWIQCVGSRDTVCGNGYCSSVCCMYATKEATMAREHDGNIEATIFYNDLRAFGKGFERYYERAKNEHGVRYVKSIASSVKENPNTHSLMLQHVSESGEQYQEEFDLVILSVGLTPTAETKELARRAGIALNDYGFVQTGKFTPNQTSRPGVFTCGVSENPMDIPETVMTASAAAGLAGELLADVRGTMVTPKVYPDEKPLNGDPPRIGVFVCHCGSNIARVVDVEDVVEFARTLGNVVHAEDNLYTCSTDTQRRIVDVIEEKNLNRVVVSSCTPRTHEPLFQEMLREAGLNKYLFEMANIRDQCSWVHANEPEAATDKARDLTRMAVARAMTLEPLSEMSYEVHKKAVVVGGGLAGMTAALSLSRQGFDSCLIEKEAQLGGRLRDLHTTLEGDDPRALLQELMRQVEHDPRITVFREAEVADFSGHVGHFQTTVRSNGVESNVEHGVVIIATGGVEYKPAEYLYGEDSRVLTQLEFEDTLETLAVAKSGNGGRGMPNQVVMIQCVGSRDDEHPYCSRVCCSEAVKNALRIKTLNPEAQVFVLYRDMRTYGFQELYYKQAREAGVLFLRYEPERKPVVSVVDGELQVDLLDTVLNRTVRLNPAYLVLSSAVRSNPNSVELAPRLKIPLDNDGFFLEAHLKLRPLDFASDGMFLCGLAQSPKTIDETISQARGAAARAATVLSKDFLSVGGLVAVVNEDDCATCLTCVRVCPFDVPVIREHAAFIEASKCQGCGSCASACPARAIQVGHYKDEQILAKLH